MAILCNLQYINDLLCMPSLNAFYLIVGENLCPALLNITFHTKIIILFLVPFAVPLVLPSCQTSLLQNFFWLCFPFICLFSYYRIWNSLPLAVCCISFVHIICSSQVFLFLWDMIVICCVSSPCLISIHRNILMIPKHIKNLVFIVWPPKVSAKYVEKQT